MSTQRQNYDQLVNPDGTYGIDIARGLYPGSGETPGVKGNKGSDGLTGSKGQKGQRGQVGIGVDGTKGTKGHKGAMGPTGNPGTKGQKGTAGIASSKGQKGGKGEPGVKGQKGQEAAAPVFTFMGTVPSFTDLPATGNTVGDVYQTTDDDFLYAWDGTGWVTIAEAIGVVKGDKGDKGTKGTAGTDGTKGTKGDLGQKGASGASSSKGQKGQDGQKGATGAGDKGQKGADGTDGTNGTKGQKGQKGADIETDLYYTKGQVDGLIQDFRPAQDAFNPFEYSVSTNRITSGTVDFDSTDPADPIFNEGIVTISSNVTVSNQPFDAFRYLVVNMVNYTSGTKDATYALVQQVYNASPANGTTVQGAFRYIKPGAGEESPWHQTTFDPAAYVTTADFNAATDIDLSVTNNAADDTENLTLSQDGTGIANVPFKAQGGLQLFQADGGIAIDGSALSGQNTFQGGILATATDPAATAQDPATLDPDPQGGDYFIFANTGTAWDGSAVNAGDWAIYRASDPAGWITLDYAGQDPGVTSLTVTGGILTQTGTAAAPEIGLTSQNLLESGVIESIQLGSVLRNQQLVDMADVQFNFSSIYDPAKYITQGPDNEPPPATDGGYSVVPGENAIWFNSADALAPINQRINALCGASFPGSKWAIYATNGEWSGTVTYVTSSQGGGNTKVIFKEASAVALVQGAAIGSGAWEVKLVANNGLFNNDALVYSSSDGKWVPKQVATETEIASSYAALAPATSNQNIFTNAQRWKYATASGSNSGWTIEGRTSDNGSTTQSLVTVTRGSNNDRDKFIYNAPSGGAFTLNEVVNGSILNSKLAGYMPNTGNAIVDGNVVASATNSQNGYVISEDTAGQSGVILFPSGTINVRGSQNSINMTGSQYAKMNIGTQTEWTELIVYTMGPTGSALNSERGTMRLGLASSTATNVFEIFGQLNAAGSSGQNQIFAVKKDGTASCIQAPTELADYSNSTLVTKQAIVTGLEAASPVGTVTMNVASTAPTGWFGVGATFNIAEHPLLHAALQNFPGYVSGTVPSLPALTGLHAIVKNDTF